MLEFTLGGFVFAIINFLILVALLYKFFHKPLLQVLEKRRTQIESAMEEARKQTSEAEALRSAYDEKLAAIEDERDALLAQAKERVQQERDEILKQGRKSAQQETENARREWERKEREATNDLRESVLQVSAGVATKILSEVADQSVEKRLVELTLGVLDEMAQRSEDERTSLTSGDTPVRLVTAGELPDDLQKTLLEKIRAVASGDAPVEVVVDTALVGGLRVEFVSEAIDASLVGMTASLLEGLGSASGNAETSAQGAQPTATKDG